MGNKKATGFLCLRLVPCFAYVGAEDNRKGIPFVKIVSLLCKLIQFLMVALSVTVHKALILLVFLNHPYQSLAFQRLRGLFVLPHLLCTSDDKWLETAIFRQQSGNSDPEGRWFESSLAHQNSPWNSEGCFSFPL